MKKIIKSFKYAFEGIFTGIKEEQNIKIHIAIMILVIIFGIILKMSKIENRKHSRFNNERKK